MNVDSGIELFRHGCLMRLRRMRYAGWNLRESRGYGCFAIFTGQRRQKILKVNAVLAGKHFEKPVE